VWIFTFVTRAYSSEFSQESINFENDLSENGGPDDTNAFAVSLYPTFCDGDFGSQSGTAISIENRDASSDNNGHLRSGPLVDPQKQPLVFGGQSAEMTDGDSLLTLVLNYQIISVAN
jgi:hypothetical protein